MGTNQFVLLLIGGIIVAISIFIGVSIFDTQHRTSCKDALITDLNSLGRDAYLFKTRSSAMGGGNGSYEQYRIAENGPWGLKNLNATYVITTQTATSIMFLAGSKDIAGGEITISFDAAGKIASGPTVTGF